MHQQRSVEDRELQQKKLGCVANYSAT